MNNNLAFIFTNYNNSEFTEEAVKSIYNNNIKDEIKFDIIVVDNNSNCDNKNILENLSDFYDKVKIIFLTKNLGYFNGLNEGINQLPKPVKNYDFVVIGNNDLFFKRNFINSVYKNYNLFKKYPVVSPDIIRLDGFHQNPHVIKPISKFRSFIYELYFLNFYLSKVIIFIANLTQKYTQRKDRKYNRITTLMLSSPWKAWATAAPVSPEVAVRMVIGAPSLMRARHWAINRPPKSLKASVGPWNNSRQ